MPIPRDREEIEELIRNHGPVTRDSIIRVHGGKASQTGELFSKDHLEYESDDGMESLDFYSTGVCDRGHFLGSGGNEIAGQCSVCGAWLCSKEGCMWMCHRGHPVCGKHARTLEDGRTYCDKHGPWLDFEKLAARTKLFFSNTGKVLGVLGKVLVVCGKVLKKLMASWWPFPE